MRADFNIQRQQNQESVVQRLLARGLQQDLCLALIQIGGQAVRQALVTASQRFVGFSAAPGRSYASTVGAARPEGRSDPRAA